MNWRGYGTRTPPGFTGADLNEQTSVLARGLQALSKARLIVDVGCGAGRSSSKLPPSARVIALDVDGDVLARAPRRPNVLYVRGDATRMPLASSAVDGSYSFGLLQILGLAGNEHIRQALRELQRVLRGSGVAIIGTLADFRSQQADSRSLTGAEVSKCMKGTFTLNELIGLMDTDCSGKQARYWYIEAHPVATDRKNSVGNGADFVTT